MFIEQSFLRDNLRLDQIARLRRFYGANEGAIIQGELERRLSNRDTTLQQIDIHLNELENDWVLTDGVLMRKNGI